MNISSRAQIMTSLSHFRPEIFVADCAIIVHNSGTPEQQNEMRSILHWADRQGLHRFWHCNADIFKAAFRHTQHSVPLNSATVVPSCPVFCPSCHTWLVSPELLHGHFRPDPLTSDDLARNYGNMPATWLRWCQVVAESSTRLMLLLQRDRLGMMPLQRSMARSRVMPELYNNTSDVANAAQVAFVIQLGHSPVRCPRCKVWLAHPWYITAHEQNPSRCYLARRAALVGIDRAPLKPTLALAHVTGSVNSMTNVPRTRTLFRLVSRAVTRPKLLHRAHVVLNTFHLLDLLQQHPSMEQLFTILVETGWIKATKLPANTPCPGTIGLTKLVRMQLKLMDSMPWLV